MNKLVYALLKIYNCNIITLLKKTIYAKLNLCSVTSIFLVLLLTIHSSYCHRKYELQKIAKITIYRKGRRKLDYQQHQHAISANQKFSSIEILSSHLSTCTRELSLANTSIFLFSHTDFPNTIFNSFFIILILNLLVGKLISSVWSVA